MNAGVNSLLGEAAVFRGRARENRIPTKDVRPHTAGGCELPSTPSSYRYTDGRDTITFGGMVMGNHDWDNRSTMIWLGVAAGAALGLGIALSRRRPTRWDSAREFGQRISERSGDLADATQDILQRVRTIYEEGRKVLEDAGELWSHGRKLVTR